MTTHPAPSLCGLAKDKSELFRERYTILQQVSDFCSRKNKICKYDIIAFLMLSFFFSREYIDMNSLPHPQ